MVRHAACTALSWLWQYVCTQSAQITHLKAFAALRIGFHCYIASSRMTSLLPYCFPISHIPCIVTSSPLLLLLFSGFQWVFFSFGWPKDKLPYREQTVIDCAEFLAAVAGLIFWSIPEFPYAVLQSLNTTQPYQTQNGVKPGRIWPEVIIKCTFVSFSGAPCSVGSSICHIGFIGSCCYMEARVSNSIPVFVSLLASAIELTVGTYPHSLSLQLSN